MARPEQLVAAQALLASRFVEHDLAGREGRIALIGLRGAGKSTLGALLARAADLQEIFEHREAMYGRADLIVETSGREIPETLAELKRLLPAAA